jgi:hypothetical protein
MTSVSATRRGKINVGFSALGSTISSWKENVFEEDTLARNAGQQEDVLYF